MGEIERSSDKIYIDTEECKIYKNVFSLLKPAACLATKNIINLYKNSFYRCNISRLYILSQSVSSGTCQ